MIKAMLLGFGIALLVSGCGAVRCKFSHGPDDSEEASARVVMPPMVITVAGYGAVDTTIINKAQQRLMALRASEVDAYRSMAERVRGVQISGNTKVEDFITRYDHLNAALESVIRQAKIVSQNVLEDGVCETILSLELNQDFYRMITQPGEAVVTAGQSRADAVEPENDPVRMPTLSLNVQQHNLVAPMEFIK